MGEICEINFLAGGDGSRRLMKDKLSKFKYEGSPVFKDKDGTLTADLRNSDWSGPASITINGIETYVAVNYKTGHVGNHDEDLKIINGIKYDKKKGKVVKGHVEGGGLRGVKKGKGKGKGTEGGRKKLFGGFMNGLCAAV